MLTQCVCKRDLWSLFFTSVIINVTWTLSILFYNIAYTYVYAYTIGIFGLELKLFPFQVMYITTLHQLWNSMRYLNVSAFCYSSFNLTVIFAAKKIYKPVVHSLQSPASQQGLSDHGRPPRTRLHNHPLYLYLLRILTPLQQVLRKPSNVAWVT